MGANVKGPQPGCNIRAAALFLWGSVSSLSQGMPAGPYCMLQQKGCALSQGSGVILGLFSCSIPPCIFVGRVPQKAGVGRCKEVKNW